jgi:hypothetical protein
MKLYSEKAGASIKMIPDHEFVTILRSIIEKENIQSVFESGTYLGTGSTTTVADVFVNTKKLPKNFITVETNLEYFKRAKKNLTKYNFINPVFGLSVDYLEAVKFLVNDDIFNNLEEYDYVYIDHVSKPQHGYLKEIMAGVLQLENRNTPAKKRRNIFSSAKRDSFEFKNNMLSEFCETLRNETVLIILDSSAGIGFYEFSQVRNLMAKRNYYIILDDIQHLKHFRSKEYIECHPEEFELLGINMESGWLIARSITVANAN